MVINNISIHKTKHLITLSADVAFKDSKPERMYFETDIKNKSFINSDYSPFLAAVLLPCMKTGEDIVINGHVSQRLLENTKKIMKLVEGWNVGLKRVRISVVIPAKAGIHGSPIKSGMTSLDNSRPNFAKASMGEHARSINSRVGVFFSAGVDSFYTYLKHTKQITDLVLVHGFDVPLPNKLLFDKVKRNIESVAKEEGKNLVIVKTNIAEIVEKHLIWDFAHGGALAAVALFLSSKLSSIHISSAVRSDKLFPYGTHPDLDRLWSTEKIQIIHTGTEYCRLEKVMKKIGKSPLALAHLHVCTQNIKGKYNCSKCFKCLTTMIELVCAGVISKSKTFSKKLNLDSVRKMYYDYGLLYNILGEANLEELRKQNREPELQFAIEESLVKSKRKKPSHIITKLISSFDQKYNKRRIYRLIFAMNKKQDRNLLFKFLLERGVFK